MNDGFVTSLSAGASKEWHRTECPASAKQGEKITLVKAHPLEGMQLAVLAAGAFREEGDGRATLQHHPAVLQTLLL